MTRTLRDTRTRGHDVPLQFRLYPVLVTCDYVNIRSGSGGYALLRCIWVRTLADVSDKKNVVVRAHSEWIFCYRYHDSVIRLNIKRTEILPCFRTLQIIFIASSASFYLSSLTPSPQNLIYELAPMFPMNWDVTPPYVPKVFCHPNFNHLDAYSSVQTNSHPFIYIYIYIYRCSCVFLQKCLFCYSVYPKNTFWCSQNRVKSRLPQTIQRVASAKNLGVWFDHRFSWSEHIAKTCGKVYGSHLSYSPKDSFPTCSLTSTPDYILWVTSFPRAIKIIIEKARESVQRLCLIRLWTKPIVWHVWSHTPSDCNIINI